ncbi:hypothetical protein EI94DRAFT_1208400 [Lactarius quietus]|nr:hypothetical protein EI94DRAFT_1208400 [Lactarius quietus]
MRSYPAVPPHAIRPTLQSVSRFAQVNWEHFLHKSLQRLLDDRRNTAVVLSIPNDPQHGQAEPYGHSLRLFGRRCRLRRGNYLALWCLSCISESQHQDSKRPYYPTPVLRPDGEASSVTQEPSDAARGPRGLWPRRAHRQRTGHYTRRATRCRGVQRIRAVHTRGGLLHFPRACYQLLWRWRVTRLSQAVVLAGGLGIVRSQFARKSKISPGTCAIVSRDRLRKCVAFDVTLAMYLPVEPRWPVRLVEAATCIFRLPRVSSKAFLHWGPEHYGPLIARNQMVGLWQVSAAESSSGAHRTASTSALARRCPLAAHAPRISYASPRLPRRAWLSLSHS